MLPWFIVWFVVNPFQVQVPVTAMCFMNRALVFGVFKVVGGLHSGHRWSEKASCEADGTQQVDICWGVVS